MKLFIRKLGGMVGLLFAALFFVSALSWVLVQYSGVFTLDPQINVLVLGDSHTKYAIDDQLIPGLVNLSKDADSYFYTFLKLRKILDDNPHVDTVLLSFATQNMDESIDTMWFLDKDHLGDRLKFYYPLLSLRDIGFLIQHAPIELITNSFTQVLTPLYFISKGLSIYGGYAPLDHNRLREELQKKTGQSEPRLDWPESQIEIKYLNHIYQYCRQRKIELILIHTPIHSAARHDMEKLYQVYHRYFADIPFLDFNNMKLTDDCYGDLYHLTPKGAEIFSLLIANERLGGLLRMGQGE